MSWVWSEVPQKLNTAVPFTGSRSRVGGISSCAIITVPSARGDTDKAVRSRETFQWGVEQGLEERITRRVRYSQA